MCVATLMHKQRVISVKNTDILEVCGQYDFKCSVQKKLKALLKIN